MSEEKLWYVIYKIECIDRRYNLPYFGQCMKKNFENGDREENHRFACNYENGVPYKYKVYTYIREHGGFDNFEMVQLNTIFGLKRDALLNETAFIKKFGLENCLNSMVSLYETEEERKEAKKECRKQAYKKNPEIFRARDKKAYHKDIKKSRERVRKSRKKFYHKDIEKGRKRNRESYKKNGSKPIKCQYCNTSVVKVYMKKHQKKTITCLKVQLALPFTPDLHKMCTICDTKILINERENFKHDCDWQLRDDNRPLRKKRKL